MDEMKLNSIGSIVRYNSSEYMVIGYKACETDNRIVPCYVVVPIPMGYLEAESLRLLAADKVETLVQEGLRNDICLKYVDSIENRYKVLSGLSADEWRAEEQGFIDALKELEEKTNG